MTRSAFAMILGLALTGCVYVGWKQIDSQGFDRDENERSAIQRALRNSERITQNLAKNALANPRDPVFVAAHQNFDVAARIARDFYQSFRGETRLVDPTLDFTLAQETRLLLVQETSEAAFALPDGSVAVSTSLVEALATRYGESENSPLTGIFLHELVHFYQGDSIDYWSNLDGRDDFMDAEASRALSELSRLVPVISYQYEHRAWTSYQAIKELEELYEYGADYGAVQLLKALRFDPGLYSEAMQDLYNASRAAGGDQNAQFEQRMECLRELLSHEPRMIAKTFVLSDRLSSFSTRKFPELIVSSVATPENVAVFDQPRLLYKAIFQDEAPDDLTEKQLVALTQDSVMYDVFFDCAIGHVFPDRRNEDGDVRLPFFDTSAVGMYYMTLYGAMQHHED